MKMNKRGTVFQPRKPTTAARFADSQRVKNVLRNTTGAAVRINLDQTATIFGGKRR